MGTSQRFMFSVGVCKELPCFFYDDEMVTLYIRSPSWLAALLTRYSCSRFFLFLLVFSCTCQLAVAASESCSLRLAKMEIHYRDCARKEILALTCSGRCHSYTQVNPNHPELLETSCRCCRELNNSQRARVRLKCPAKNSVRRQELVIVRVSLPRSCVCRPCST